MEVVSKRLHIHAAPVVMVLGGLLILASVTLSGTADRSLAVVQSLFSPIIEVQPQPNGLARFRAHQSANATVSDTNAQLQNTGSTAAWDLSVQ